MGHPNRGESSEGKKEIGIQRTLKTKGHGTILKVRRREEEHGKLHRSFL